MKKHCANKAFQITQDDLPLCCPPLHEKNNSTHPRVYLDIQPGETVVCKYCSCAYTLIEEKNSK